MTVSELIELLKQYPQDAPTAYTWDGIVELIYESDVYLSKDGVVMIGVDYRQDFISGILSARKVAGIIP